MVIQSLIPMESTLFLYTSMDVEEKYTYDIIIIISLKLICIQFIITIATDCH